jgi:hypothetical protein
MGLFGGICPKILIFSQYSLVMKYQFFGLKFFYALLTIKKDDKCKTKLRLYLYWLLFYHMLFGGKTTVQLRSKMAFQEVFVVALVGSLLRVLREISTIIIPSKHIFCWILSSFRNMLSYEIISKHRIRLNNLLLWITSMV